MIKFIPSKLRKEMQVSNMSKKDMMYALSEKTGVQPGYATVDRWTKGLSQPEGSHLYGICKLFGRDIFYFYEENA